jgi:sterol desaturase/sphingolipid hydroxylase (fatty acid hydroxylase superfamily)
MDIKIEEALLLAFPATYLVMLGVESLFPARPFPKVRWWRSLGVLGLAMVMSVSIVTPMLLPVEWLERHRLIDASKLGVPLGVVAGYLVVSLLSSLWHRALHESTLLWRLCHQMHHAPRRLDLSGGNVFHPLDVLMFTVVQVVALTLVIGLDPLAAALTGYVAGFYTLFQHWNVRTPRWLGFVIQRPEAHCKHHELGVHASNYSDFPLWDLLLGSFDSPERFDGRVGFDKPSPFLKMLFFVDVNDQRGSRMRAIAPGPSERDVRAS